MIFFDALDKHISRAMELGGPNYARIKQVRAGGIGQGIREVAECIEVAGMACVSMIVCACASFKV